MFPTIVGAWVLDGGGRGEDGSAILDWTEPRLCYCECGRGRVRRWWERVAATAELDFRRRDVSWSVKDETKSAGDKAELRDGGSAGVFEVGTAPVALGNEGQVAGSKTGKWRSCVYKVVVICKNRH